VSKYASSVPWDPDGVDKYRQYWRPGGSLAGGESKVRK
jgi:hypothetical protein